MLVEAAAQRGAASERCLALTGLTPAGLQDSSGQIDPLQELQVARNVLRLVGDVPGLGLDAGRRVRLGNVGIWGFAVLSSPTVEAALALGLRFARLVPGFLRPERELAGGELRLVLHDDDIPADVRELLVERDLAALAMLLRAILGSGAPVRLETRLGGESAAALAGLLPAGRIVGGRPRHLLAGDPALLPSALALADDTTRRALERECESLLAQRRTRTGMAARVRSRLLVRPGAMPSRDQVADELGVKTRTLHRHLVSEGTSFRALVEEVHETLATELLINTGLSVEDVSQRLGYSDAVSFTHAFKRWTGEAPGRFRERSESSGAGHVGDHGAQ